MWSLTYQQSVFKRYHSDKHLSEFYLRDSVAEWLACWTQAQKGPGSNRSRDAVG